MKAKARSSISWPQRFDIVVPLSGRAQRRHFGASRRQIVRASPFAVRQRARSKTCVLGNGMVIDPKAFFEEADRLSAARYSHHSENA
jgi:hypothetical protein